MTTTGTAAPRLARGRPRSSFPGRSATAYHRPGDLTPRGGSRFPGGPLKVTMLAATALTFGAVSVAAASSDCGTWQTIAVFLLGVVLPQPHRFVQKDGPGGEE